MFKDISYTDVRSFSGEETDRNHEGRGHGLGVGLQDQQPRPRRGQVHRQRHREVEAVRAPAYQSNEVKSLTF